MEQRGRKGVASLTLVRGLPGSGRPEPPDRLNEVGAEVWRAVVAAQPADWFRPGNLPLLEAYCGLVAQHRVLAAEEKAFDPTWLKEQGGLQRLDMLQRMKDRVEARMVQLATKMRLTQQANYRADAAGVATKTPQASGKPWEGGATGT